jgi:hypothetical protein
VKARLSRLCQAIGIAALCLLVGGPVAASVAHRSPRPPRGSVGNDVGDFSCSTTLPSGGSFGIVGTTAGKPFHMSPCLSAEYTWARGLAYRPQYYLNLADPGRRSPHWGRGGPRQCHRGTRYDVGCAYNYGYEAAAAAWRYVLSVGSAGHGRWWLDVEVDNTWGASRAGIAANVADIRGALSYLRARPHVAVGIYTETSWWALITANSTAFSHTPVWGGGASSKHNALQNCRTHSITGAAALLAQWIAGGVDHDLAC